MNPILEDLYSRADDKTLMMSMRNVHAMNIFSFVLAVNERGSLTRVFYTPSNVLESNYPFSRNMSIGLHNHLYDIVLIGLQGKAVSYQFAKVDNPRVEEAVLYHYYWSSYAGGVGRHSLSGLKAARLISSQELEHGAPFTLRQDEFHTVWAEPGAAWLVQEGTGTRQETELLSTHSIGRVSPDMYQKFKNAAEVRKTFEAIFA